MKKTKPVRANKTKTENQQLNLFIKVQIFAVITYLTLFLIGSFLALRADISRKYDLIFTLIIFAISSLAVGFFAGIKLRQNGLISGILYSLPMNLLTIVISLLLNDFTFSVNIIITAVILILSSGIGGILAVNKRLRR